MSITNNYTGAQIIILRVEEVQVTKGKPSNVVVYLSTRPAPTGELRCEEDEFWQHHTEGTLLERLASFVLISIGIAMGVFGGLGLLGVW